MFAKEEYRSSGVTGVQKKKQKEKRMRK